MLWLSAVFPLLAVGVYAGYAVVAQTLRGHILDRPSVARRAERGLAVIFALLAARLATATR